MIAQISPGEISGVYHALKYAEDLVVDWLVKYKFKNWIVTETRGVAVTEKMKLSRAQEIAKELTNHAKWRSHGRSIKIRDLEEIGLKVTRVENDDNLNDVVYRIQTVCRLLFSSTNTYKIFATEKDKVFKSAAPMSTTQRIPIKQEPDVVEIETICPKCAKVYRLYAKFIDDPRVDENFKKKGDIAFPKDNKLKCDCGFEIDLGGIRNEIEIKTGKKLIT